MGRGRDVHLELEERVVERVADVEPPVRVKVEQAPDEVAEALADDRVLRDDGLRGGSPGRQRGGVAACESGGAGAGRTSSGFMPLRNFFDALSVVAFG